MKVQPDIVSVWTTGKDSVVFIVVRVVLLIALAVVGFILYGHVLSLMASLLPQGLDLQSVVGLLLLQGFLAALVVGSSMSYPIAWLAGRHALWAAVAAVLPVLVFRVPSLFDTTVHGITTVIMVYEVFAYVTLLGVGTLLVHRRLSARATQTE
ncbi:hypothetical protein [Guyparkeria sp. TX1]|uniref:hypothetical protein n=1 Tax=Guyparkeria sp. TX1 TaxID=3115001 RepID=UPI003977680D